MRRLDSFFVALDRSAPLQRQIGEALRQAIAAGALAPGTRLPGARTLAAQLRVSRTTVVAALVDLVAQGYLEARTRSGTFVSRAPPVKESAPRARPPQKSPLRLSRRIGELAERARARGNPRPRAFRLSRPALDAFPVREWSRILARRAARVTIAQLDYGEESPELREAIAELVSSSRGTRVTAEQVLVFAGSQEALEFAAQAVLDPGDRAWMEDPGYPGARNALLAAGARVACVPVDEEGLDVAAGERLANDARLVYVTPSCQFPLGVTMSLARRRALLRWARVANACVVEDDYDGEFADTRLSALHGLDRDGRVLYVGSFSRTMFPAIRVGYLIAPPGLAARLRAARDAAEQNPATLTQLALADFISEGHFVTHVRRMRVLYRARREAVLAAARAAGVHVVPGAGLHVIAELPSDVDAVAVAGRCAARGIEVAPLAEFHAERPAPRALALGFGAVDPARARDGMEQLARAISAVRRRRA